MKSYFSQDDLAWLYSCVGELNKNISSQHCKRTYDVALYYRTLLIPKDVQMAITASTLRENIYRLQDQVLELG